ncbi:MAG: hypothetical protein K8S23_03955 [Candidatus Cloacimonetes bacterium]|nr:hypothetical protein [Candidatus Cloacimonadota bacterium]
MKKSLFVIFVVLAIGINATTINVPGDYGTLQQAINASTDGDVIIAANGWYLELINFNGKNVTLTSNYYVSGDTLDIQNTVIHGGQNGTVVTFENNETENAVLNGFTVTFGLAENGGGIKIRGASPTLSNLIIKQNFTTNNGAGIYITYRYIDIDEIYYSSPMLYNVEIDDNESDNYAGGLYSDNNSTLEMENVSITNNESDNHGAGYYSDNSVIEMDNVSFYNNQPQTDGKYGSGMYASNCTITIDNSIFDNNGNIDSDNCDKGGGLFLSECNINILNTLIVNNYSLRGGGGLIAFNSTIIISDSNVYNNSCRWVWSSWGGTRGVGIALEYSNADITNCSFYENYITVNYASGIGLGFSHCPLINIIDSNIINNYITSNHYDLQGGGIYHSDGELNISNCIITGNGVGSSDNTPQYGGGLFFDNLTFRVDNSLVSDNYSQKYGGGIYATNSSGSFINTEIKQNQADYQGAGIYLNNTSPRFEYVVIAQNNTTNSDGGGVYCSTNSEPYFINSTICDNQATNGGGIVAMNNSNPSFINTIMYFNLPEQLYFSSSGSPNSAKITYSDFEGGLTGIVTNGNGMAIWMGGNITDDPLLDADYILTENSPCIDAGTDYVNWFGEVIVDIPPEDYYGTAPDMGAIEYDVPGIYSSDGNLDFGYQELNTTETLTLDITNYSTVDVTIDVRR